jgi:hypothetical protein
MEFRMRIRCLFGCIAFLSFAASAQDWQSCKPEGDYSFNDVKAAVHRVTSSQGYSGWDEKTFNRSGDLVAVAVLKTLPDSEMASLEHANSVLLIARLGRRGQPDLRNYQNSENSRAESSRAWNHCNQNHQR